ncbi:radical SAM protein, partial [Candidatus Omnitrophota bacterium]
KHRENAVPNFEIYYKNRFKQENAISTLAEEAAEENEEVKEQLLRLRSAQKNLEETSESRDQINLMAAQIKLAKMQKKLYEALLPIALERLQSEDKPALEELREQLKRADRIESEILHLAFILYRLYESEFTIDFMRKVVMVFSCLYAAPDIRAAELMPIAEIEKPSDLVHVFKFIRDSKELQELFRNHPTHRNFFDKISGFISEEAQMERMLEKSATFPLALEMHPSTVCNSKCIFCYDKDHWYYNEENEGVAPLTADDWVKLVDECAENNLQKLYLLGPDPLEAPAKTIAILKRAKEKGVKTVLFTNGIALDPKNKELMDAVLGADQVFVSLRAFTQDNYDRIAKTGKPEDFKKVLAGIDYLVSEKEKGNSKASIGIAVVINRFNYVELDEVLGFAKARKLDMVGLSTDNISGLDDADGSRGLDVLSEEEKKDLKERTRKLMADFESEKEARKKDKNAPPLFSLAVNDTLLRLAYPNDELPDIYKYKLRNAETCQTHYIKPAINPYGKVVVCCLAAQAGLVDRMPGELLLGEIASDYSGARLTQIMHEAKDKVYARQACPFCNPSENNGLIAFEKLKDDHEQGIPFYAQPFRVRRDSDSPIAQKENMSNVIRKVGVARISSFETEDQYSSIYISKYESIYSGMYKEINDLIEKIVKLNGLSENVQGVIRALLGDDRERLDLLRNKTLVIVEGEGQLMRFGKDQNILSIKRSAFLNTDLLFMEFLRKLLLARKPMSELTIEERIRIAMEKTALFLAFPEDVQANMLQEIEKKDSDIADKEFYGIFKKMKERGQGMGVSIDDIRNYVLTTLPNDGVGEQIVFDFDTKSYFVEVVPQEHDASGEEPYSGRFRYDLKDRKAYWDGAEVDFAEHAENHRSLIAENIIKHKHKQKYETREIVAVLPHGNCMTNEGFVAFVNGKLYHPDGEEPYASGKTYTCFVMWEDGNASVEELEFDEKRAFIAGTNKRNEITNNITCAVSGQQIVRYGKPVDLESLYDKFTDLKQIFLYPKFKYEDGRDLFFGVADMHGDKAMFGKVFSGEPISFSKESLFGKRTTKNEIIRHENFSHIFRAAMSSIGYEEGEDKDYTIGENDVTIRIKLNPYAHSLIGVKQVEKQPRATTSEKGNIITMTCTGDSRKHVGITIRELQKLAIDKGAKDIIMLSNGGDVQILDGEGKKLVASAGARDRVPTLIFITKKFILPQMSGEEIWQKLFHFSSDLQDLGKQVIYHDPNTGKANTIADHVHGLITFEHELSEEIKKGRRGNPVAVLNRRRAGGIEELSRERVERFIAHYKGVTRSAGAARKLMLLRLALCLHDIGKCEAGVEDRFAHLRHAQPVIEDLEKKEVITEGEAKLVLALVFLHDNLNTIHFGEGVPKDMQVYLENNGVNQTLFYELAPLLYIFDVGASGRGALSDIHLENADFYLNPHDIHKLSEVWPEVRLYRGFCGNGRIPIAFHSLNYLLGAEMPPYLDRPTKAPEDLNASILELKDADFWGYTRLREGLLQNVAFAGHAVFIFRGLYEKSRNQLRGEAEGKVSQEDRSVDGVNNLLKLLYLLSKIYESDLCKKETAGHDFNLVLFSKPEDRYYEDDKVAEKLNKLLNKVGVKDINEMFKVKKASSFIYTSGTKLSFGHIRRKLGIHFSIVPEGVADKAYSKLVIDTSRLAVPSEVRSLGRIFRKKTSSQLSAFTLLQVLIALTGIGAVAMLAVYAVKRMSGRIRKKSKETVISDSTENVKNYDTRVPEVHPLPKVVLDEPAAKEHKITSDPVTAEPDENVTELFQIVEGYVNNRRTTLVNTANDLLAHLEEQVDPDIEIDTERIDAQNLTVDIKDRMERLVELAKTHHKGKLKEEFTSFINNADSNLEIFEGDAFTAAVITLARQLKAEGRKLRIPIETDWVPGYKDKYSWQSNAIKKLMDTIEELPEILHSMGLEDAVEIIHKKRGDEETVEEWIDRWISDDLSSTLILASSKIVKNLNETRLKNLSDSKKPLLLAGVDPTKLNTYYEGPDKHNITLRDEQICIQITEMLLISLELATGKKAPPEFTVASSGIQVT